MAVRVAVLSDSHVGQRISAYPEDFLRELEDFDLILHAGDHTNLKSLRTLRKIGDVRAVRGNMDEIGISSQLPQKFIIDLEGKKIGVTHGWGAAAGLEERVREAFRSNPPDIVVFGHSHIPCDVVIRNVRMLNPGSISGNNHTGQCTWGILTIDGENVDWRIVKMES